MGVAQMQVNALMRLNGVDHRVRRQIDETSWQFEEVRTGRIVEFEFPSILRKIEVGELTFATTGFSPSPAAVRGDIPPEDVELAKLRRLYVRATSGLPNTRSAMEAAVFEMWQQLKKPAKAPGWVTVYKWKKKYLAAGEDFRALLDNNHRKGNRTARYPSDIHEICKQAIAATYLKRERTSIKVTLEDAVIRVRAENRQRPEGMTLPLPTRRYMTRLINQIPAFERCVAQKGREEARRRFRAVNGHRLTERPLERVEMDHRRVRHRGPATRDRTRERRACQ